MRIEPMRSGRGSVIRAAAALALALGIAAGPGTALAGTPNYAWQLFHATNDSRQRHDVHRLDQAFRMSDEAQRHSERMARHHRLWHTNGPTQYDAHCYSWGENVGYTSGSVEDLEKAFMASADHRSHILDAGFHRVAVGAATRNGKLWVTVFFCT
jgi:uncharacterized protein YkwD